jgi:hypothetical protein
MELVAQPALDAALQKMWVKFLPLMEERIAVLDAAADALSLGALALDQHTAARSAAHKLAGVLGHDSSSRG